MWLATKIKRVLQSSGLDGIHTHTLTFKNPAVERVFVSSRSDKVLLGTAQVTVGFIVGISFWTTIILYRYNRQENTFLASGVWVAEVQLFISLALLFLQFGMLLMVRLPCIVRRVSTYMQEVAMVLSCASIMLVFLMAERCYLPTILGIPMEEVYVSLTQDICTDSRLLMGLVGMVAISHTTLPVRWCVVAPLGALALVIYGVATVVLGSPEASNAPLNT